MTAKSVLQKLIKKGLTIAFSESITGGSLAYAFIKNPGASNAVKGSVVAYSEEAKTSLLGINPQVIIEHTTVSERVSNDMAIAAASLFHTSIGVGVTGNAGPNFEAGTHEKTAYISLYFNHAIQSYKVDLSPYSRIKSIAEIVRFSVQKIDELIT